MKSDDPKLVPWDGDEEELVNLYNSHSTWYLFGPDVEVVDGNDG